MKTASYRFGKFFFKAFFKPVGQGWEVSVTFDRKNIFVGNFIHRAEASTWWNIVNREIRTFTKTYWIANKAAKTWYGNFFSAHLYKNYYKYLDRLFARYQRTYSTQFSKNVRRYNSARRNWNPQDRFYLTRKAA
jgi:hypothetical protein